MNGRSKEKKKFLIRQRRGTSPTNYQKEEQQERNGRGSAQASDPDQTPPKKNKNGGGPQKDYKDAAKRNTDYRVQACKCRNSTDEGNNPQSGGGKSHTKKKEE